mgnify:CR=1 FL=1
MPSIQTPRRIVAASLLTLIAGSTAAQPNEYTIRRLGIIDSNHARISTTAFLESNGWVAGHTQRAFTSMRSAWASRNDQSYRLGLLDSAHSTSTGLHDSSVLAFDRRGIGVGTSRSFEPVSGLSAWVWDREAGSRRIGLIDAAHTSGQGAQVSQPRTRIASSGRVAGQSTRYLGNSTFGYSAWIADVESAATTRVGLFDAEHTAASGLQFAQPVSISDTGAVFGFSVRFSGSLITGRSAWIDPIGSGPVHIGLIDAEHTNSGGYKSSVIRAANAQGLAIGSSIRYSGTSSAGASAWLYDGDSTRRLGFTDADHTRADGRKNSLARSLTPSGYVSGASTRYLSTTNQTGQSAWLYDPTDQSTTRIGAFDTIHTRADGMQHSEPLITLDGGLVGGTSRRYDGMASLGNSIWIHADTTSHIVSPGDALHTRADGTREAMLSAITTFGRAAGTAARYDGAIAKGHSAWIYDPASDTTSIVGLFDADHSSGGFHESSLLTLTDTFAVGTTERQSGFDGSTLWFHDLASDTTTPLIFDTAIDGRYATSVFTTTNAGEVIGAYANYDGNTYTRDRLFIWDAMQGFRDLELATDAFDPNWIALNSVVATANGSGLISGNGEYRSGGVHEAYLLTAIAPGLVPAPPTLALLGALALGSRRRRD